MSIETSSGSVAHPAYSAKASPERITSLQDGVAPLMTMPESEMVALVPDRTGFRFMGCPNCDGGTQEGQLDWRIEDPDRVRCRYCEMTFPNETFPEDRVLRVTNPIGVEVEYPYWEDEAGYRFFFSARGWREARVYFSGAAQRMGELYQVTGDRHYARRSCLILDAFARHYPGFLVSADWPHRPKGFVLEPPYPNGGGKWGRWRSDEMPTDCVLAYDSIYESGELERLADETGADVKARIEEDFFRGAIRQDGHHGPTYGNASPRIYRGYAVIGRVLGDPLLVHEAVRRSRGIFECQFYEDGFWCEGSVGYHRMTMNGMAQVFQALIGYSDPPGYLDAEDGTRFDDLDLERDIPIISRAARIPGICRYPDGRTMPVHDNRARPADTVGAGDVGSVLLRGVGHAWLSAGSGGTQTQVHLHFSGGYGHEHADSLNLSLFAKGKELLPDLGYTHTKFRSWSTSTLCHNTVVVDEQRQYTRGDKGPSDGRLEAFEVGYPTVRWIQAGGEQAYPGLTDAYRRRTFLVEAGEGDAYVVDVFEVVGGAQHDWALHGSADEDGAVKTSVPVTPFGEHLLPGAKITWPTGEADRGDAEGRNPSYAFFQNVSAGEGRNGMTVGFSIDQSGVAVRSHLLNASGAQVYVGDAMSFRRADEDDTRLDEVRMPIFLMRRSGRPPLSSTFIAVHEPYEGTPFVDGVRLDQGEGLVVSVRHHGLTDHIAIGDDPEAQVSGEGDLELRGGVGFVRERNGSALTMGLWGGRSIRWRDRVVTGDGVYEGVVTGVLRTEDGDPCDGLVLDAILPEGDALSGCSAIVTFGDGTSRGCTVRGVTHTEQGTQVALHEDPGFATSEHGARHLYFPRRELPGEVRVRIRTSASWQG